MMQGEEKIFSLLRNILKMYRVRKENKEDIYIYGQLEDLQVISQ